MMWFRQPVFPRIALTAVAILVFTACVPRPVLLPIPHTYSVRSEGHRHLIRVDVQHPLAQLLIDLGCGSALCTLADAGDAVVVTLRRETVVAESLPTRSNKEFMKALGCGPVFLCSTDGTTVTILKGKS